MTFFGNVLHYLSLGFTHVLPLGWDHILFILSLFFFSAKLKTVILQCSVFTVAHSISLGLAAAGIVVASPDYVEPLITFSILFTAVENLLSTRANPFRLMVIFGFGLIHGLGFATALSETGIPEDAFLSSLFSFNLGVELGQVTVILLAYILIGKWFSDKTWYRERIIFPISCCIGCIALYWTLERLLP